MASVGVLLVRNLDNLRIGDLIRCHWDWHSWWLFLAFVVGAVSTGGYMADTGLVGVLR